MSRKHFSLVVAIFVAVLVADRAVVAGALEEEDVTLATGLATLDAAVTTCGDNLVVDKEKNADLNNMWNVRLAKQKDDQLLRLYNAMKVDHEQRLNNDNERSLETKCIASAIMVRVKLGKAAPIIKYLKAGQYKDFK